MEEDKTQSETPKATEAPKVTLESIQAEVEKMRNDFATTLKEKDEQYQKSLKEKDDLINDMKKQIEENNQVIGDFKEKLFNTSMPSEQIKTAQDYLEENYRHAYAKIFKGLENRVVGHDIGEFIERCMKVKYDL